MSRSGEGISPQIAKFDNMDLSTGNFKLEGNLKFNIKNEGTETVELEVIPADSDTDDFITTKFEPGWNAEIVREVKQNSTEGLALKWGY